MIENFTCYSQSECSIKITESYDKYFNNSNITNSVLITYFSFLNITENKNNLSNTNNLFALSHIVLLVVFTIGYIYLICMHYKINSYYLMYYSIMICIGIVLYLSVYYIFLLPQLNEYDDMRSFGFPHGAILQANAFLGKCKSTIECFNDLIKVYRSNGPVSAIINGTQYKGPKQNLIYIIISPVCFSILAFVLLIIEYYKIKLTTHELSDNNDSTPLIQNIDIIDINNDKENTNDDLIDTYKGPRSPTINIIKKTHRKYSESF